LNQIHLWTHNPFNSQRKSHKLTSFDRTTVEKQKIPTAATSKAHNNNQTMLRTVQAQGSQFLN